MRNQYKILSEKYHLVKENEKEDILGGLDAAAEHQKQLEAMLSDLESVYDADYANEVKLLKRTAYWLMHYAGLTGKEVQCVNFPEVWLAYDEEGNELENSIQGFIDPNEEYTKGKVAFEKIKLIKKDKENGSLHNQYYYYPDANVDFWEAGFWGGNQLYE